MVCGEELFGGQDAVVKRLVLIGAREVHIRHVHKGAHVGVADGKLLILPPKLAGS